MNYVSTVVRREPALALNGILHLVLFSVFCAMFFIDERTVMGINAWIKPMKFALSISIFCLTLAWIWPELPEKQRKKHYFGALIALMLFGEIVLIGLQAWRGVPSHFNHTTALNDAIYSAMGGMIVVVTVLMIIVTWRYARALESNASAYRTGILYGLVIFLVGSFVGGAMSGIDQHSVGGSDGGAGLPFLNWSTEHGDLRAAHFLGLHAIQVLPLLGFLFDRRQNARSKIQIASILYGLVLLALLAWTIAGNAPTP